MIGFSREMPSLCTCPSPGLLAHSQDVSCALALLIGREDHMAACCSEKQGFCSLEGWRKRKGEGGEREGEAERQDRTRETE